VYTSRHTPPTPSHLLLAIVAQGNSKSPPPRRARPARAAADAQPRTVWVPLSATDDHQWSDHDESSPPDVASIGGNGGNGSGATSTSGSQYGHHGGHHSGHHGDSKSNKPKRKQVKQACYQCRKAHAACGDERPCVRCQAKGIADQCSNSAPSSSDLSRTEPSHSPGFGDLLDPSSSLGHAAGTAASAAAVAAAVATPTPGVGLPIGSAASSTSSLGGGGSTQHRSKRRRTEQDGTLRSAIWNRFIAIASSQLRCCLWCWCLPRDRDTTFATQSGEWCSPARRFCSRAPRTSPTERARLAAITSCTRPARWDRRSRAGPPRPPPVCFLHHIPLAPPMILLLLFLPLLRPNNPMHLASALLVMIAFHNRLAHPHTHAHAHTRARTSTPVSVVPITR